MDLQLQPVRASIPVSRDFTLPMGSSRRFGSSNTDYRPIQTRFPFGFSYTRLSLACITNSLAHSSIGTQSSYLRRTPTPCRLRISGSISLPFQGFFSPFPHGTIRYRCRTVFSLTRWYGLIHTRLPLSSATRDHTHRRGIHFAYGTFTLYGLPSQVVQLCIPFVTP